MRGGMMKLWYAAVLLTLTLYAGESSGTYGKVSKQDNVYKKTVSLVLGSGGARGYAHIGVIEELQKQGFKIVSVSGSSMGALIGGLYAAGKLEEYKRWVLNLDTFEVLGLIDFSFDSGGLIDAQKVYEKIDKIIGDVRIEELPIPYTAVASDINHRKKVWFTKGRLTDAIRASIAIPTVFTPVLKEDMLLVDGGVLSPLPLEPVAQSHADLTIVVNLNANVPNRYHVVLSKAHQAQEDNLYNEVMRYYNELFGRKDNMTQKDTMDVFYVFSRTMDAMEDLISRNDISKYRPDVVINIPRESCESYEFHKARTMIEIGKMATKESLQKLEKKEKK
jgi:NTE family protein